MGKADTATRAYTCQPDVFADAFNMYLYGGRQVLFPEQLRELDSTEFSAPFGAEGRRFTESPEITRDTAGANFFPVFIGKTDFIR